MTRAAAVLLPWLVAHHSCSCGEGKRCNECPSVEVFVVDIVDDGSLVRVIVALVGATGVWLGVIHNLTVGGNRVGCR